MGKWLVFNGGSAWSSLIVETNNSQSRLKNCYYTQTEQKNIFEVKEYMIFIVFVIKKVQLTFDSIALVPNSFD